MRILFVTDAWHPQVNGVVETLTNLARHLTGMGIETGFLTPQAFSTVPMPFYGDIRLAVTGSAAVALRIRAARPDHVHIVTEGPLGFMARSICLREGVPFTTSYHTKFPEYLRARLPVPTAVTYACLRRFHNSARATLVATQTLADDLRGRGFDKIRLWGRGVDMGRYHPARRRPMGCAGPIFLYVGRVAVEKNLPAFLDLDLPGGKMVVGDGPDLARLRALYPQVRFMGARFGEDLARIYASCDAFVFPSVTDTFGIVLLEALASGLPVAAFPVTGPADIIVDGKGGVLSHDLRDACLQALKIGRDEARAVAAGHSWQACAELFLRHVSGANERIELAVPAPHPRGLPVG